MKDIPSSFSGTLVAITQALDSYGLEGKKLMVEAGIVVPPAGTNKRVLVDTVQQAIKLALEASGDPTFGLRFANFVHPATYHALGMALLCSSTIRDFFLRLERSYPLITTIEKVSFRECGGLGCLESRLLGAVNEGTGRCHADGWAAFVTKFIRLVFRPDYCPLQVRLMWPPPIGFEHKYQEYFGVPVEFSAPANELYFKADDLDIPLPASNVELARHHDQVVVEFLASIDKSSLPAKVRAKLIEFLPSGECSKERVARALNMSIRAFHNKLEKEGASYQELLDNTRKELAEQYIAKMDMSISEVAYLMGFSDSSNFSRSFKRWTGMSPKEFRASLL